MRFVELIKRVIFASLLVALLVGSYSGAVLRSEFDDGRGDSGNGMSLAPSPLSLDRITHDRGNIITTLDNHGYIGGWGYYGQPSGEWPRNSGHDYIGEMLYWMGGVNSDGDTLVADSYDDFQALPMPVGGSNEYTIYLSSDTTRFYNYDPTDTVGLGNDNAASGWRVWNSSLDAYAYNESYSPLATAFEPGGPTSMQESFYRFNDAALGSSLLGLELTQTMLQWNYCYNEDIIFVKLDIKNVSGNDLTDFAFGLYADIDVGGPDGTGENGRLGDLTGYDLSRDLAWIYDADNSDPGWGSTVTTGYMGTRILKSPQDIGVTAVRTGEWEELGDALDKTKFSYLNSTQVDDQTVPRDLLYVQCTRGIDLPAGSSVEVIYAIVAAEDEDGLKATADMAKQLFDANYVGPEPPPLPTLLARPSDGKVYLHWSDVSENGLDPMSGANDFAGYKLYRSDNQGKTWGKVDEDNTNSCLSLDYVPVKLYSVADPGDPIPHTFIDDGLYNGVEYWYCLVAFDQGDPGAGVDILQSGFGIAAQASNVIAVTPGKNPAGLIAASATVTHDYTGTEQLAATQVIPIIFDQSETLGIEYQVVFEDDLAGTYWHLINVTTGDTILLDQTQLNEVEDMYEIVEGIRVVVLDAERDPSSIAQTGFGGFDTSISIAALSGPIIAYWTGQERHAFGAAQYRASYEIRYSTDSTQAVSMWEGFDGVPYPRTPVPFEVWNMTTGQRVWLGMDEWPVDGSWAPGEGLFIIDYAYDPVDDITALTFPYQYGWRFEVDGMSYNPVAGDIVTIGGAPLAGPGDAFSFKVDAVNSAAARSNLKNIKVVPNPYFANYSSMVETAAGKSVLTFTGVPDECTVRIYTLAGELVQTLVNISGSGVIEWDLLSQDRIQIASGIYLFHIESPYGEHLGRFAIVK